MLNIIVSNLLIIITVLAVCGWILMSIRAISSVQSFNSSILVSDKIQETAKEEFVLSNSSNILKNSLDEDINIILLNHPLPHNSIPATFDTTLRQLKQTLLQADEIAVNEIVDENIKIHSNSLSGINKSNQEYYIKKESQKQQTPLLSNIELAASSNLSPSSTPSSSSSSSSSSSTPEATAATAASFRPTNSKFPVPSYFERVEMHESLMRSKNGKLLLHRNKRYLVFPEGSSLQLVFDLIIPIVDYTNFAIMGITCAVAWELPSKPPSEIIENIRTKLNDDTFGLSRRNDSALQSLVYINSQRTEQQTAEDQKRWRDGGIAEVYKYNLPQLSATTTTTSGREHFLTNVRKPPLLQPSSNFNYNYNYIQRKKNDQPISLSYGQQAQQQHNYDYETFDTNQGKTLYANQLGKKPMHRNDVYPFVNKRVYYKSLGLPASKWNFQNWQQAAHQQQPQQTRISYSDGGSYFNEDNWWKRNKNRIEKHSHKPQPKWLEYQQNPQLNFLKRVPSTRTGRIRKILKKPPKHRIYPIFGKRRRRQSSANHQIYFDNDAVAKELHDIHTKEHLQTRLKLYGKIEQLLKTRGQNGTACVLRALCETERMHLNSYNKTPQSFVAELLRTIFALPTDTLTHPKESLIQVDDHYVNAVFQAHDVTQTCSQHYVDCGYSITYNT